jgi:hypothetical protein
MSEWSEVTKAAHPRSEAEVGFAKAHIEYHEHPPDRMYFEERLYDHLILTGWVSQGLDVCCLRDIWRHREHGTHDGIDAARISGFTHGPMVDPAPPTRKELR